MTHKTLYSVLLLLSVVVLGACHSTDATRKPVAQRTPQSTQVETVNADGIRRITIHDLEELRTNGKVFIVDVRNQAAFDQGHLPGAVLIPSNEVATRIKEFPRDKTIVTYCS